MLQPQATAYDSRGSSYRSDEMVLIVNPISGDSELQRGYDEYVGDAGGPGYNEESTAAYSFIQMQPRNEVPYK